jgi:hypothetical protein
MPENDDDEQIVPMAARHVVMTPTGVTFVFNEEDQRRARRCLEKSGRITINFAEVTLTGLSEVRRLEEPLGKVPAPDAGVGPID